MSDPQHANYSRYIYTRDGRVYGYLFTDSEGNQWGDLLPGRGPISHRHHTGSLHAAAGHHLHHGFAHHHSGHHPHHLRTVAAATDSFAGHRRAIPAEDPDERRIRELAIAINREAGSVGDGRAILEFYALSLAGAVMVLSLPAAGLWLNEQILGELEGRLFWSGWSQGAMEAAQNYAVGYGGRVIAGSGVGILLDELGQGPIQDFMWGVFVKVLGLWSTFQRRRYRRLHLLGR